MTNFLVDLHTHSTASDGKLSPTDLVKLAANKGLYAISLTDHDTVAGLDEAITAGNIYNVQVVPGIEFSIRSEPDKHFVAIHLLGYFIDYHNPDFEEIIKRVQDARLEQKIKQIEKLQSFGFDIPVDVVLEQVTGVPGRPHIAAVLMTRNPGHFETTQQVFDEYLGSGKKAHVGRTFALTVAEASALILKVGGLPVLAHPGVYDKRLSRKAMLENAIEVGVKGLEVYYPYDKVKDSMALVAQFEAMARHYNLIMTGGTDYHAKANSTTQLGDMGLSIDAFEAIKARVSGL